MTMRITGRGRKARMVTVVRATTVTVALMTALSVVGSSQTVPVTLPSESSLPQITCGTRVDDGLRGIRRRAVQVADGETLSFEQDPPLMLPNYGGRVTLRRFSVVGDVPTLDFHRWNPDNPAGDLETWQRTTTRPIGGRLISVFEPSWDATVVAQPVPSRLAPGTVLRLAGRVTATDQVDFNQVGLIFYRANSLDPVRFFGPVSRTGDFSIDVRFSEAQQGRHSAGVYLFWPNAGSQYARTVRSTFVVQ